MTDQIIKCPNCKKDIPLTDVLTDQIKEKVRKELEIELNEKEKNIEKGREELVKKTKEVEIAKKNIEEEVVKRAEVAKEDLKKEVRKEAEKELSFDMKDLKEQIKEKDTKIKEARDNELLLRKKQRGIEAKEKDIDLEIARGIDQQAKKIEEDNLKKIEEEYKLKFLEKEKLISNLNDKINDLKRQGEQGSQQLQGEVQELDLENFLKERFIFDDIQPVPKGVGGADILQKVYTKKEIFCGIILWEAKRTKNWTETWITKLKEDQREAKADLAVIVSDVLPKGLNSFGFRNGVWITNNSSLFGLSFALRDMLIKVAITKLAAEGKDEKVELLFQYLTGPDFKQRVEAVIETFNTMKEELNKEKRTTIARWGKQEKQIERVVKITSGMYGNLKGLIGGPMQAIPLLEMEDDEED